MPEKPVREMPDIRLREAVAVYLYGLDYTDDKLRGIGILPRGRWYCWPNKGSYTQDGKKILVTMDRC
jgi:hypothetical protein